MMNEKLTSTGNPRLLAVTSSFPEYTNRSIIGVFIKNQLNFINDMFSKVTVVAPVIRRWGILDKNPQMVDYSYNNIEVIYPKAFFVPRAGLKRIAIDKWQKGIEKGVKKRNVSFDLIHAHYGIIGRSCVPVSQKYNKPLITSFYGYDAYRYIYDSKYYRNLFKNAVKILTLSNHMSQQIKKLGCPSEKIQKLRLGVNIDHFKPKEREKDFKDNHSLKILSVANFVEQKGIFDTIKAFYRVNKEIKNIHLDLVGKGVLKEQIEKQINSLNLTGQITITDNQSTNNPRETVLDFMQNCDIFILPSIISTNGDSEGTPVSLMEASACGKPCITTFHSGNPEVVVNNKTGLVVPESDTDRLEEALKKLILSEKLRNKFGENARIHIQSEFNSILQAKKLKQIYKEVFEEHV